MRSFESHRGIKTRRSGLPRSLGFRPSHSLGFEHHRPGFGGNPLVPGQLLSQGHISAVAWKRLERGVEGNVGSAVQSGVVADATGGGVTRVAETAPQVFAQNRIDKHPAIPRPVHTGRVRSRPGLERPREHKSSIGVRANKASFDFPADFFIDGRLSGSLHEVVVVWVAERTVAGGEKAGLVAAAFSVARIA